MITRRQWEQARRWAWEFVRSSGLPLREQEFGQIEVVDLGLGELETTGLQILTLAGTDWVGVKLLILRPRQFFPQHRHPPSLGGDYPGKTEVLHGHYGKAFLYVPGNPTLAAQAGPPPDRRPYCSVWHEILIEPGNQHICPPNTWHWFQAGERGAVLWSISSRITDAADQFSDPQVVRETKILEEPS